jgi:hypothetical protein
MTSKSNNTTTYIPASSGWFAHHLIWLPVDENVHDQDSWKFFVKVSPVALWAKTDEYTMNLEPVVPGTSPMSALQNGGFMSATMNYAFIGVFHHDSYRMGDVVPLPYDYNPIEVLDSEYVKGGVSSDDLSELMINIRDTALNLKEEAGEERRKEQFANKMRLMEEKAAIDEELRIATLVLELNESGGGIATQ